MEGAGAKRGIQSQIIVEKGIITTTALHAARDARTCIPNGYIASVTSVGHLSENPVMIRMKAAY